MEHLDLFSGIGGFSLSAEWVWGLDHHIHSFVEIDPFCQKVLKKHWPEVPIHDDIRTYKHDGTAIDLLTGGFPCQPFSCAGKQRGKEDDRWLWPQMLRIIQESNPTWIIGENVAGIINMELDKVLSDLEDSGYSVQAFVLPACGVNAPHRRDRVWIVAKSVRNGRGEVGPRQPSAPGQNDVENTDPFSIIQRRHGIGWPPGVGWWEREPSEVIQFTRQGRGQEDGLPELESQLGRVANGIPNRVDRLKSLGNSIVPKVAVPIMQAIKQIEDQCQN